MAAYQDSGSAEDAAKGSLSHIRWAEKDEEGRPLSKRSRSGKTRRWISHVDQRVEMSAHQDSGEAEDAMFLADLYLAEEKAKKDNSKQTSEGRKYHIRWVDKDEDGRPLPTRSRSGQTRRRISAASKDLNPFEVTEEAPDSNPQCLIDTELQKLQEILASVDVDLPIEPPSTSSSWNVRQAAARDEWQKARPYHLDCLLSSRVVPERNCSHCSSAAVLRCRECMPEEWMCSECDILKHTKFALHNRQSCTEGFYKPISPTVCFVKVNGKNTQCCQERLLPTVRPVQLCTCDPVHLSEAAGRAIIFICMNGRYDLHLPVVVCRLCQLQWTPDRNDLIKSGYWPASVNADTLFAVDVFHMFAEMKTAAPGLSRQSFLQMFEARTQLFGRTGRIHGDVFQRSFMEYTFCQFQCDKMSFVEHFMCPACTPNMIAICADGNRKLYRFKQSAGSEEPYFLGTFIADDIDVFHFVEEVRSKVKNTQGKGACGTSQWSAARETARSAHRLDEEGLEVAVCRHGVLFKALNMFRGEIFAYPLFLQKELHAITSVQFYCTDIACKYWPYLKKVAVSMPELGSLLQMSPFLSVMHAKAHSTKCEIVWSGRNLEGAGTTAGEEVEMVNSYLSRCALTTKYMTKCARNDMLTVHAIGWNQRKLNTLHLSLSNRYIKTVSKTDEASQNLQNLCSELGCPENMVQQWVHDVREWASDDSIDASCDDRRALQQSIEQMFLGVHRKKACLYNHTDSNKIRHLRRKKLREEKVKLFEAIKHFNEQVPEEDSINVEMVESRLAVVGEDNGTGSLIWPWELQRNETTSILSKKKIFDAYMSKKRLQEEKVILMREMRQHCSYLRGQEGSIRRLLCEVSTGQHGDNLTEEGRCGLMCLLQEKLADIEQKIKVVSSRYSMALGATASLLPEDWNEEIPEEENNRQTSDTSDDSDSDI